MYCDNVLDVILVATARALKLILTIYQKGLKGNIHILEHTTHTAGKEVYLKFTCEPSNHYETILLLNKHTERNTEEEVTIKIHVPTPLSSQ